MNTPDQLWKADTEYYKTTDAHNDLLQSVEVEHIYSLLDRDFYLQQRKYKIEAEWPCLSYLH